MKPRAWTLRRLASAAKPPALAAGAGLSLPYACTIMSSYAGPHQGCALCAALLLAIVLRTVAVPQLSCVKRDERSFRQRICSTCRDIRVHHLQATASAGPGRDPHRGGSGGARNPRRSQGGWQPVRVAVWPPRLQHRAVPASVLPGMSVRPTHRVLRLCLSSVAETTQTSCEASLRGASTVDAACDMSPRGGERRRTRRRAAAWTTAPASRLAPPSSASRWPPRCGRTSIWGSLRSAPGLCPALAGLCACLHRYERL